MYDDRVTSRGALTPEQQLKVLARVWDRPQDADGWVFLPWIPGTCRTKEDRRRNWNEGRAYKWPQDKDAVLKHLENHQKDDLYFTPTTFLGESRIAQLTGEETVLYADLDEVDPTRDIDKELKPTIAWETSPNRYQAVWVLSEFADGATDAGGLNHRLTAYLGADPSGWDCTQLLRVPGRRNYKPDYRDDETGDAPPGRLLWAIDKKYTVPFFESNLPTVETYGIGETIEDSEIVNVDRHTVWGRVRLKVSHNVREYMGMKSRQIDPDQHDRSAIMWQIERDLADADCSVAEIVAIIRPTPWNKHAGRNNEMSQLIAEAQKARAVVSKDAEEDTLEGESAPSNRPDSPVWLSAWIERSIPRPRWAVNEIWVLGSCGFIAAEPKSFKSYFGLDMALSMAIGGNFLNDPNFRCKQRKVLYLQEEDNEAMVKYRLAQILEGKSPDDFYYGQITLDTSSHDTTRARSLGDDWGIIWTPPRRTIDTMSMHVRMGFRVSDPGWQSWLMEFIQAEGFAQVFIDTLGVTLGDITLTDDRLYPRVLNPLKEISSQTKAGINIVHHNKKNAGDVRRGQAMTGSTALHAWAESALYLSKDPRETGKPEVIKVERESKMDQDMKFRVEIPKMYEDLGHMATQPEIRRQLWEPTVKTGWAEQGEEKPEEKRSSKGQEVYDYVLGRSPVAWVTFDRIKSGYGHSPGATQMHLNNAVDSGLLEFDGEKAYRVRA